MLLRSMKFKPPGKQREETGGRRGGREADISSLPRELLTAIATLLGSRVDIFRSRAVWQKWRSSFLLSLNPNPGLLSPILPRKISANLPFTGHNSLILVACGVFLIQPLDSSSEGWILSVEEAKQGKLRLLFPLSRARVTNLPDDFPKSLNLSEFRVSQIGKGYNFRDACTGFDLFDSLTNRSCGFCALKVVIFPEPADVNPSIDGSMAMVLFGGGTLLALASRTQKWGYVRLSMASPFDDILIFKGMFCTVDRIGRVYAIDGKTLKVEKTIVDIPIGNAGNNDMRKRLVESFGKLYLVVRLCAPRGRARFRVLKLNEALQRWDEVHSLGDRVLFISFDCCFFVSTGNLQGCEANCIVFPYSCFRSYDGSYGDDIHLFRTASENLKIGVYRLENGNNFGLMSSYGGISNLLWPPPTWFWPDTYSPSGNSDVNQEAPLDLCHQNALAESLKQNVKTPCTSNHLKNANGAVEPETTTEVMLPSHRVSSIPRPLKPCRINPSTVKFQGVDVRSELVPILEKVWSKYGDIVEGSAIHSSDIIAIALESLAKVIIILQNTSAKALTDHQAHYLISTLSDIRCMRLKVNWLVPFVEKAMALHKSKRLPSALVKLEKAKARVEEMEKKFIAQLAELDAGSKLVPGGIPLLSGPIDFDKCLGEGLF